MPHTHELFAASVVFGLSVAWTAVAQTASPKPESSLLQSAHVVGDTVEGFRKTCLIVYPDGEYHRERRRQVSSNGRAQFEWEAPEVFEAKLTADDLNALKAILETPEFSSVKGAVGDGRSLSSKLLVIDRNGAIIPHENIEIVTVAVARSIAPQVFELVDVGLARRQESLRAFLDWIKGMERSHAQRFAASEANNCSSLIATSNVSFGGATLDKGLTPPKAIYAPGPKPPHDAPKPHPVTVELLIDPDGSVAQVALQGHPNPEVAQSVIDAVRKWKFQPARLLGVPIAKTIHLKIEFGSK